ncbi:3498_t:CDS:2 [Acaulospora morrowiae]|uniref:3498_t:CDS:1 n=1 Tax=Acaulospora morrowiae TaxID=94023 RepID=A0A9N9F6I8_9GLOM|nr:3498_t:CDS:2 [Acaulospora morrowiae]
MFNRKPDYEGDVTLPKFYSFGYHCVSSTQPSSSSREVFSSFSQNPHKGYIDITSTCSLISFDLVKSHGLESFVKSWDQKNLTLKESPRVRKRPVLSLKTRFHSGRQPPFVNARSATSKRNEAAKTRRKSEQYWINIENGSVFYKNDHEDSNEFESREIEHYAGDVNRIVLGKHKGLEIMGTLYVRVFIGPEDEEEEWKPFHLVVVKDMSELRIEDLDIQELGMIDFKLGTDYLQDIDVDNICFSYMPKIRFENEISINLFDVKKVDPITERGYGSTEKSSEGSSNSESEEESCPINNKIVRIKSEIDDPGIVSTENLTKPDQITTRSNSLSQSSNVTLALVKSEEESQPDSPQDLNNPCDSLLEANQDGSDQSSRITNSLNSSDDTREPIKNEQQTRLDRIHFESETPNNADCSHSVIIQQSWVGLPLAFIMNHLLSNVSTSNNLLISSIGVQQPMTGSCKPPQVSVEIQTFPSEPVIKPQVSQSTASTQTVTEEFSPKTEASPSQDHNQAEVSTQTPNSQSTQILKVSQHSQSTQTLNVLQISQSTQTPQFSQYSQECQISDPETASVRLQTPCDMILSHEEITEVSNSNQGENIEVEQKMERRKHQVEAVEHGKKRSWTFSLLNFVLFLGIFSGIGLVIIEKLRNEELSYC